MFFKPFYTVQFSVSVSLCVKRMFFFFQSINTNDYCCPIFSPINRRQRRCTTQPIIAQSLYQCNQLTKHTSINVRRIPGITMTTTILWIAGVYGDVQRVKILYNKKDSALIQMAEPHQAYLGEYIHRNVFVVFILFN